jgi:NADP-dependent 3-hydroxy acid dehydrogenase YdfG
MHHAVLKGMAARGAGKVVNIASDAARVGSSGEAVYAFCKGGLLSFSKTMARELAQKWKKPVTAGSDAHVPEEVGGGVTVLEADELSLSAVKAALLRGAKQVEGRRGRAMCVARSQKTKREKTNAGVKRRVNGMLFTVKCALQDFTTREDGWHVMDR